MVHEDVDLGSYSLADYTTMFALSPQDLEKSILDFYSGSSSFNAELSVKNPQVRSFDPLFGRPPETISAAVHENFAKRLQYLKTHAENFYWQSYASPEVLAGVRQKNMEFFLKDYKSGLAEQRYQFMELPFVTTQNFDLALCPFYLFSYNRDPNINNQLELIYQLCHLSKEVRIFPLLDSTGKIPPAFAEIGAALNAQNYGVEIKAIPDYPLQEKGNALLRIAKQSCVIE